VSKALLRLFFGELTILTYILVVLPLGECLRD